MTRPIADVVERRKGGRPSHGTLASVAGTAFLASAESAEPSKMVWPSKRYRADPVGFARDVLGLELWDKQAAIVESVRDHKRTAACSGQKAGKTEAACAAALWFYACFDGATVVMSATTSRQVDEILWRTVKRLHRRSGTCVACRKAAEIKDEEPPRPCPHSGILDGKPADLARSGLRASNDRQITGFTAKEAEAVAGVSGKNLLYVLDEASGIPEDVHEAVKGNQAGGGRVLMLSNPTKTEGEFFDAFHTKSDFYSTIHVNTEESPNVTAKREIFPGLATYETIQTWRQEYGEESAFYLVRVLGKFLTKEEGKVLSLDAITQSEERWRDEQHRRTKGVGPLVIGIDPAGEGQGGDESAFAARRAYRIVRLLALRGLTEDGHLAHLLGLIRDETVPGDELATVVIDSEGPVGARVYAHLQAYAFRNSTSFRLVRVRSSEWSTLMPRVYERKRDELWANLGQWVKEGGALIPDTKLAKEVHVPEWIELPNGRRKVTSKEDMKKKLKRSPDRADAVCLACWRYSNLVADDADPGDARTETLESPRVPVLDPYAGLDVWRTK